MVRKPTSQKRHAAYLRVSTDKQGRSGLGLEAQREAVRAYLATQRVDRTGVREFIEVESGKRDNRPVLSEALDFCAASNSTLVIAKLDRLSRDAHFLIGLQKSNVMFVAADMPQANKMTVGIMALVAQHEREVISERTKAALAAAKRRGVKLGNPHGARPLLKARKGNKAAVVAIQARAKAYAERLRKTIEAIQQRGVTAAQAIARELNAIGCTTPKGSQFTAKAVQRVLSRLA